MSIPAIEFHDFSFRYGAQQEPTLRHIDLVIEKGEKVLLLGRSGSGKSTLANCINGLIPFSYKGDIVGSCKVSGIETREAGMFELSRHVGTVLQDSDAQFVGLSVGEDIAFELENQNIARRIMLPKVMDAARTVGMESFVDHVPYELSGGQKQKVSLAGVLHDEVGILLFDEPLAALDPKAGMEAIELMDSMHQSGKTVVIIEHRLEDVLHRPVDRIVLLDEGSIVFNGSADNLLASGLLAAYGIREPLYLAAIASAGCTVAAADRPSSLETLDMERFFKPLRDHFHASEMVQDPVFGDVVVQVEDVSFSYDADEVLSEVSFIVHKGERIAFVGKNGAGKSTMAKLLCGIVRPDKGTVSVCGKNAAAMSIKELGLLVGYVMQNPNQMIVKDSVIDEVSLGLQLHGMSPAVVAKRSEEALRMCGLYPMRNWPVSALSYGQRKRVTVAAMLALHPGVIILDEPTAGQDYRHYTEIMRFLDALNKEHGITIIFITHDMHLAIEYTDRAVVFSDGKVIADAPVHEILADPGTIAKANLKQTSLYALAGMLGLDPDLYIGHFIAAERKERGHA